MKILSFVVHDASSVIKQLDKIGKELIPFIVCTQIFEDKMKLSFEEKSNM